MANGSPLLKRFAGVTPRPGVAYLRKDRLAYADPGSSRVGVNESDMCATFVVTTEDSDRVGDVVVTKGIDLTHFRKNPVGFYGHQVLPLPIGKWEDPDGECTVELGRKKATGTLYFSQRSREAAQVFALVAEGILRATSIGFNPLQEPRPRPGAGYLFPAVDLLEASVVGVPAQPTATLVRQCLSRNKLAGWPIVPAIRKSLGALAEEAPEMVTGGWSAEGEDAMSKRLGKTTPKGQAARPVKVALPCGCLKNVLALIPKEVKDELQDCVSAKIPKLIDEGYDQDQAAAIAYSMCGEDKALAEGNGQQGGYTTPEDDDGEEKQAAPAVAKQPPPPPRRGDRQQQQDDPPDRAAPEQEQEQPPPRQEQGPDQDDARDPKAVLNRLVDALTDYLDLTGAANPADPEDVDDDEDEEDDDLEEGTDHSDKPMSEEEGKERYEFRDAAPEAVKGDEVDLRLVLAALTPVRERVQAARNAWDTLQGRMPE